MEIWPGIISLHSKSSNNKQGRHKQNRACGEGDYKLLNF